MPVINRLSTLHAANRQLLRVRHFAKGTYPEANPAPSALPVNRFFLPICNPNGKACYLADATQHFELRPGCAYFIPLFHKACMKLDRELNFLSIQFTLGPFGSVDLFSHFRTIREIPDATWLARAEAAYAEKDDEIAGIRVRGLVESFAAFLLSGMTKEQLAFATAFTAFEPELSYIQAQGSAATTVEELAALRGFRREVFTRKFTAAVGMPPKQFLSRYLMNRACDLLLREDARVREVAFELGFSNEYYFSRFFKKQTGIPPRDFKAHYLS